MQDGEQDMGGAGFIVPGAAVARQARAAIAAAQALVPAGAGTNLPLIACCIQQQLYTPAAAALREALQASPDDGALRLLLAHVYLLMGRDQARAALLNPPAAAP